MPGPGPQRIDIGRPWQEAGTGRNRRDFATCRGKPAGGAGAITSFSTKDLEKSAIRDIRDIANFTPNLTFTTDNSGRSNVPTIRGIGLVDARGFDNPVGVFIDGIFVSGRAGQNAGMLDVERVEVIKGPQSALYGRNTFSGAINYVTRPTPAQFEGKAEATLGSDSLTRVSANIGDRSPTGWPPAARSPTRTTKAPIATRVPWASAMASAAH